MSNIHKWAAEGISPQIANLQNLSCSLFPDWVETHQRGEAIFIPYVAILPEDSNVRAILESQGIQSLLAIPLMHAGECLGFVGFDAVRECRLWSEMDIFF